MKLLEFRSRKELNLKQILDEANRQLFKRECEVDGIDPKAGVSPSLLKTLETK